jgi:thymidylate kinase
MNWRRGRRDNSIATFKGAWVAFFGPDGVGKSTVIDRLQGQLEGSFCGCLRFHFRPRFGCRRTDEEPVTAPHAQTPRGLLSTTLKLAYWLLDFWLGYFFLIRPALRRSELVIFDRYFSDMLVDPVRYRLRDSARTLAALMVKFAPQPDLYVLLDAPAESVQLRKQEVSPAESHRQREAYRKLLGSLPGALVIDANRPLEQVSHDAAVAIAGFQFREAASRNRFVPEHDFTSCK